MAPLTATLRDISEAARLYPLWTALGSLEIKQRYRRSIFGPFWITVNIAAMIFGIGYIYANIFNSIRSSYIPFLAVGIVVWNFIISSLTEGSNCLIQAGPVIRNVTISKYIHVFHSLWRNLIIFFHNIIIMIPVYFIYKSFPGIGILGAIPGLILLVLFLLTSSLLIAVIGARFRDVPPAVASVLQVAFFATPIIWEPSSLGSHHWVIVLNPFFHLVECVREPLLNGTIPLLSFAIAFCLTMFTGALALIACMKAETRLIFWI
jgi:ABC-type polysaccharide/polyol phosphate export permease